LYSCRRILAFGTGASLDRVFSSGLILLTSLDLSAVC
jgi:hypothetical protein